MERREKLGGFHSKAQLRQIWGVSDSVLLMNNKRILITAPYKYINLNAEKDSLAQHYYINYNLAKLIVRYRMQHGDFEDVEELKKIMVVTDSMYNQLAPYLMIK